MKNRTLTLAAACLMGLSAFAQWSEPEIPTTASTFTDGHLYRVRNADGLNGYLAGGYAWYGWATSTILVYETELQEPITYSITMDYDEDGNELGYIFIDNSTSLCTFISGESLYEPNATGATEPYEGLGEMHMDGAIDNDHYSRHFNITPVSGTTYQISVAASDAVYGETKAGTAWGYMPKAEEYIGAVWPFLDPSNADYACTWEFIDMTMYQARLDLYDALVESTNYSNIDQSVINAATTVYDNASATLEELEAAIQDVKQARNEAIVKDASSNNPVDATSLIENPDFETGNIDGWYCSFVSGVNAINVGFQAGGDGYFNTSETYVNHEGVATTPFCKNFIEAWTATTYTDDAPASACIGDGELSQTIKEMPAGNWRLSADVIACQQYDNTVTEQYGVQLFATSGDYDMSIDISTGNGVPEHIELLFASSGADLTLGLRTQNTNCNWICADNFELTCYGNEDSAYKFILQQTISDCEAEFPYTDEVKANAQVIAAYEDAFSEAQSALESSNSDEELEAASDALTAAAAALRVSVAEYEAVAEYIDYILSIEVTANENGWDGLVDELAEYREDTLEPGYEDGDLTSEQIAEMEDIVSNMIADYVSENCKAGDDVSILIRNNDFDTDFSDWTVSGATPAWGGMSQDANSVENGVDQYSLGSGNAEVFHAVFDISQTIKNMPVGLYTLSCQAFARDDDGDGVQGELYAVLDGEEQNQTIKSLYAEGSPEQQYASSDASYYFNDVETTLEDGTTAWVPNGMDGANIYFSLGYYYNYFNILVTKRSDLTIGIRDTGTDDWVLFDTFRLVYQGNDASNYADYIEELIEQAIAINDNVIVDEADNMLVDAITEGENALDGNDAEACIAAIQSLQNAIAYAEESIALVEDLDYLYNYTVEIRMPEVEITTDSSLDELVEEIDAALNGDGFETNAQVEGYMTSLKAGFTTYVMAPYLDGTLDATESDPADITPVIMTSESTDNAGEGSTYGWDIASGTTVGLGSGCAEIYEDYQDPKIGAGMSQVLYNLAAGYYRLGVQGFYRPLGWTDAIEAGAVEEADTLYADTIHYADIYAGDKATRVLSIYADAKAYDTLFGNGGTGEQLAVPASMEAANNAFQEGLYNNVLQFEVAEDGTDVTIGIVKTQSIEDDWLIWDNWTLLYLGTTEPAEDPTTDITGVESEGTPVATAIYNVNGMLQSRLTKGINIVKTTMADGTVNVTKVLVK